MEKENIEQILNSLGTEQIPPDVHKIAEDISHSFTKTLTQAKPPEHRLLWKCIKKSQAAKLAIAAVIFIAFGIGFFTGRWSKPPRLAPHSLDVTSYDSVVSVYPTSPKAEDGFWRQKALAAIQPRAYEQTLTTKTSLLNAYKQYLKEKHYD